MTVVQGYEGSLRDGSGNMVGEITGFTLTIEQNTEQHNAFGSAWVTTTATNKSWNVDGTGFHDPNDAYQDNIITDIISGDSKYDIELRVEGDTAGDKKYTGEVVLGNVALEGVADGVIGFSFSGQGNGSTTQGAVT